MSTDDQLEEILRRLDRIDARLEQIPADSYRVGDRLPRRLYHQLEALIGLYRELDGRPTLPPLRNWSISPDAARELHALVLAHRPAHVVECGGGASTVLFAHLCATGMIEHVTALEHLVPYLEATRQQLERAGVVDHVDLIHAPLRTYDIGGQPYAWYDLRPDDLDPIDLLLVDGPPGTVQQHARYPAIPLLEPRLNHGCLVVVDDHSRKDEAEIVERWVEEAPLDLIRIDRNVEKGMAVLGYRTKTRGGDTPRT